MLKISLAGANNSVPLTGLTQCIIIVAPKKKATPAGIPWCREWRHSAYSTQVGSISQSQPLLFPTTVRFSALEIMLCLSFESFLIFLVLMELFPHGYSNPPLLPLLILLVLFHSNGKTVLFFLSPSLLLHLFPVLTINIYISPLSCH